MSPNLVLATTLAATAALLAAPATAGATTSCTYTGAPFNLLQVELPANGDSVRLGVPTPGGDISAVAGSGAIVCTGGTPTVSNTNVVSVNAGGGSNSVFLETANRFVPGATPETGDDEIEIGVDFNNQPNSRLVLIADDAGARLRAGTDGINTNADTGEDTPDTDIALVSGVALLELHGGAGGDTLDAQGGAGTGTALTQGVVLSGTGGADSIVGGEGNDLLRGGSGTNTLLGRGGNDLLVPGTGDDLLSGDAGTDEADFGLEPAAASAVSVDLTISGFQDTGESGPDLLASIENVTGTDFNDVLRGDAGSNTLSGRAGNDVVEGRGGDDTVSGDEGEDALEVRDGGPDTADCGDGTDSVTADLPGIDVLTGCETAIFPGPSDPDPGPGPGPGGGGGGDGAPLAFGARTLVTLKLVARRIPAKGPLKVRATNSNGFRVTARLSGQTTRKVSPSRKRRIPLRAKAFSVDAHAGKTVALKLPKTLRELLKRNRRLSLGLTAKVTDPAGNTRAVRKRITPRLARRP